jgi:subfamily B ATP-binding cassette protein MsbA
VRSRLFALVRPYTGVFVAGLLMAFVGSVLDGATVVFLNPLLKLQFPDSGGIGASGTRLEGFLNVLLEPFIGGLSPGAQVLRLVFLFIGAVVLKNLTSYVAAYLSVLVQEGMVRDLRARLYDHLLRVDLGIFQRTRGGQLATALVADADQVKLVVVAVLAAFFQNFVMIATTIVVLLAMSVRLTVMVLVLAPILVLGVRVLLKRLKRHAQAFAHERGELTATVSERLGAVKLVRAFGAERTESAGFAAQADRYRKWIVRTQRFALLTSPVSEIFGGAIVMLILWAASNQAISGVHMAGATTVVFIVTSLRVMSPLKAITQVPTQLAMAEASAARIFDLLDTPAVEVDRPGAKEAVFARHLVFDHVSFGYDQGTPVLQDISLTVQKGEVVALVGPSGAGKTTLLELVPRFHEPTSGELRLDGVALPELTRSSLRRLIAVVSQDTVLLHDTVRANIAYGQGNATDADVHAAAVAANAHLFIENLPDRYATVLGERGARLSGGQRQRIAIARALLRDAPILILDEATSALDTESEQMVQEAIERLMRDRTVLVIAHRLATVRNADRIAVIDDGRLVEVGTHSELLVRAGLYRRLHDLQFSMAEVTT